MEIRMNTAPKLILATIAVVAGMTAAWVPFVGPLAIYTAFLTLGYVVMLGLPVFLILRDRKKLHGQSLAIAGALSGWGPIAILSLTKITSDSSFIVGAIWLAFFGGLGLVSSLVFGAVWNLLSAKEDRFPWWPARAVKT